MNSAIALPNNLSAIITFVVYLSIVMLVGVVAYMVTRNLSDYVLGGRKLGGAVAALSAGASDMSSWLLMGLPGAIYVSGLRQVWVVVGLVLGAYCSWKFIAVKTVKEIPIARMVCMWWMSLSMVGAILVGMVGAIHFCNCPLDNHETVFIALAEQFFSPWIMGIILAAILSSSMCAVDSQMLAASSAITEDIYRSMLRPKASQRELMWIGRGTVALIAVVAILIAAKQTHSIMELVAFAWAGLGSTFGASVVFSLFWKRCTRNGVVVGMLLGAATVILWRFSALHTEMYELLPGFLISSLGLVITSLLDKAPASEITVEFDKVWGLCHGTSSDRFPK